MKADSVYGMIILRDQSQIEWIFQRKDIFLVEKIQGKAVVQIVSHGVNKILSLDMSIEEFWEGIK